jgi:hypothetical protein
MELGLQALSPPNLARQLLVTGLDSCEQSSAENAVPNLLSIQTG